MAPTGRGPGSLGAAAVRDQAHRTVAVRDTTPASAPEARITSGDGGSVFCGWPTGAAPVSSPGSSTRDDRPGS
eukprot:scaffold57728_cov31-Tisochrysis_lutea.AAC.2